MGGGLDEVPDQAFAAVLAQLTAIRGGRTNDSIVRSAVYTASLELTKQLRSSNSASIVYPNTHAAPRQYDPGTQHAIGLLAKTALTDRRCWASTASVLWRGAPQSGGSYLLTRP